MNLRKNISNIASAGERLNATARRMLLILVAVALSSCLFYTISLHDNKYEAPGNQAINGLLYVDEADCQSTPIRYLVDGWECYPDLLLTPDQLAAGQGADVMRDVSAGQHGTFSLDNPARDGQGSATYAMTLVLPETPRLYALHLPEIYSAYRLYIDGNLVAHVGNPDPENYRDATRTGQMTFWAEGETTLVIATTNHSSLYSGMVYPLAFGQPAALEALGIARTSMAAVACAITVLEAVIALIVAFMSRQNRTLALLVAGAALCSLPVISHAPLHAMFTLPVHPWHFVESICLYGALTVIVAIHNHICMVSRRNSAISLGTALALCAAIAATYILASGGNATALLMLSLLTTAFKVAVACYLLATAWVTHGIISDALPLLVADTVFATAIFWDRLIPAHEPIMGGWFVEWAMLAMAIAITFMLASNMTASYLKNASLAAQRRSMSRQLTIQAEHLRRMEEQEDIERKIRHDFRQYARTMGALAREGHIEELSRYAEEAEEVPSRNILTRLTANVELNALLQHYRLRALEGSIAFETDLKLPADLGISPIDMGIILGNALENAVDAAMSCPENEDAAPCVFVGGQVKAGQVVFMVRNTYRGNVRRDKGVFLSSKHDGPGIGIESISATVRRLGGILSITHENGWFEVMFAIPQKRTPTV